MTAPTTGLPCLGRYRAFYLYEQTAGEACLARELAARLRQARAGAQLDRQQLAAGLGVEPALLVALENGYGSPAVARPLVESAVAFCLQLAGRAD